MGKLNRFIVLKIVELLLLNRDINIKSPYCKRIQCELIEKWLPVFPELNFIILKGEFIA